MCDRVEEAFNFSPHLYFFVLPHEQLLFVHQNVCKERSIRKSAINPTLYIDLGSILEKPWVYKPWVFLRASSMFLGCPSFPQSYHGAWPAADGAAQLITFLYEPTVSYRCEDNRLAHWKGWLFWTETLLPGSSLSPSTVGLPNILGKVHPLNNSQGKINLLTWPKSSFQFLHKMVQKHQWNFWPIHSRPTHQQVC